MALIDDPVRPMPYNAALENVVSNEADLEQLLRYTKCVSMGHEYARFLNPALRHPCRNVSMPALTDCCTAANRGMAVVGTLHPTTVSRQVALGLLNHARCGVDSNSENIHWVMYRDERLHGDHIVECPVMKLLPQIADLPIIDVGRDGELYHASKVECPRVGKILRHSEPPLCVVAVGTTRQISSRSVALRDATCGQSQPCTQPDKLKQRTMRRMSCLRACLDGHQGRDYDDEVVPIIVDKNPRGGIAKLRGSEEKVVGRLVGPRRR
jgi:hypothetical protein